MPLDYTEEKIRKVIDKANLSHEEKMALENYIQMLKASSAASIQERDHGHTDDGAIKTDTRSSDNNSNDEELHNAPTVRNHQQEEESIKEDGRSWPSSTPSASYYAESMTPRATSKFGREYIRYSTSSLPITPSPRRNSYTTETEYSNNNNNSSIDIMANTYPPSSSSSSYGSSHAALGSWETSSVSSSSGIVSAPKPSASSAAHWSGEYSSLLLPRPLNERIPNMVPTSPQQGDQSGNSFYGHVTPATAITSTPVPVTTTAAAMDMPQASTIRKVSNGSSVSSAESFEQDLGLSSSPNVMSPPPQHLHKTSSPRNLGANLHHPHLDLTEIDRETDFPSPRSQIRRMQRSKSVGSPAAESMLRNSFSSFYAAKGSVGFNSTAPVSDRIDFDNEKMLLEAMKRLCAQQQSTPKKQKYMMTTVTAELKRALFERERMEKRLKKDKAASMMLETRSRSGSACSNPGSPRSSFSSASSSSTSSVTSRPDTSPWYFATSPSTPNSPSTFARASAKNLQPRILPNDNRFYDTLNKVVNTSPYSMLEEDYGQSTPRSWRSRSSSSLNYTANQHQQPTTTSNSNSNSRRNSTTTIVGDAGLHNNSINLASYNHRDSLPRSGILASSYDNIDSIHHHPSPQSVQQQQQQQYNTTTTTTTTTGDALVVSSPGGYSHQQPQQYQHHL